MKYLYLLSSIILSICFTAVSFQRDVGAAILPIDDTKAQLKDFYSKYGGRDIFPKVHVESIEALLYSQDDIKNKNYRSAQRRLKKIFYEQPLSAPIWYKDHKWKDLNVGAPIAYYGLRMLDFIASKGVIQQKGTLQLTAVIAPCAVVERPKILDHKIVTENVNLNINPQILESNYRILFQSTDLFRRWLFALTNGYYVNLKVVVLKKCTKVTYQEADGVVRAYPDSHSMINMVDKETKDLTAMWWVIAPSGVPGDGAGFNLHFITGGMGVFGRNRPLFLSDDAWFIRKPEHLGKGRYSDVERRVYLPQWFQHEIMHHLFRSWPEYKLEESGHQWFDRSKWPKDFKGEYEPDYYAESIEKRLINASPSIAEKLKASQPKLIRERNLSSFIGSYQRVPVENEWHKVNLILRKGQLIWKNIAGVQWNLVLNGGVLETDSTCPYGKQMLEVDIDSNGTIKSLWFQGEKYKKID